MPRICLNIGERCTSKLNPEAVQLLAIIGFLNGEIADADFLNSQRSGLGQDLYKTFSLNVLFLSMCIKRAGYIVGGRPLFIPLKGAQWQMKPIKYFPKCFHFLWSIER